MTETNIIGQCYRHKKTEHVKTLEISMSSLTLTFDCGFQSKYYFEE